jgi:hypothetical protein
MRSQPLVKTWKTMPGKEIQVCITPPHQFIVDHQQELLPDWNVSVAHLILFLQQSSISLQESNTRVAQEKDSLRLEFIRFAGELVYALQDQGYKSDLFDPLTGYPVYTQIGRLTLDDNAVVKTWLNYSVVDYQNCSLLLHPLWNHNVYPSTMVTSAPLNLVELLFCGD